MSEPSPSTNGPKRQPAGGCRNPIIIGLCIGTALWIYSCHNLERQRQNRLENQRVNRMVKDGYRLQLDGSFRQATRDELWWEGTLYDYRYSGLTDDHRSVEVLAMKGEQRVVVKKWGYNEDLLYCELTLNGEWVGKGKVRFTDELGMVREVRITGTK